MILHPDLVRELTLDPRDHPQGKAWLSAASSLVLVGNNAYVIADDELHLGCFTLGSADASTSSLQPVQLRRLLAGKLPRDKGKRKKAKPDFESLCLLPPLPAFPNGALLALGSGSKVNRCTALLLPLLASGDFSGEKTLFDLTDLYLPLRQHFGDLNIEGAFVSAGAIHLLQRGNKNKHESARISYEWKDFSAWLQGKRPAVPVANSIQPVLLPDSNGVPFSITDATELEDGTEAGQWLFCAVAEDTGDSYQDGACVASVVGIADSKGLVRSLYYLQGNPKVEGIAALKGDSATAELELLLVTDADDPDIASRLLRVRLPLQTIISLPIQDPA